MKILVVGGGGREHALVWKLRQSPSVTELYAAPGNAGIASLADCVPIDASSTVELADFAEKVRIDLTVVGPELPLTLGITAEFEKRGLRIFGASREAAEIESSKVFAKDFMARHGVPTAGFVSCTSFEEAVSLLKKRSKSDFPVVLKADGLAAGKGVILAENASDAEGAVTDIMKRRKFGTAGDRLVVEDFLRGVEVSFFAISDGEFVLPLVTCQDYKRIGDANRGPNTGGMGAFSPSVHVSQEAFEQVLEEVFVPVIRGMDQEGRTYRGILYAGIMLTDEGPKVLEFNARFGDPEAQVLLPRLRSDLGELLLAATEKRLEKVEVEWSRERAVCVVMASEGYPGTYPTGRPIEGLEKASAMKGVTVFHAGTDRDDQGRIRTAGGRVLGVMARSDTFEEARAGAYAAVEFVHFEGRTFRKDIAQEAVAFEHKAHAGSAAVRRTRGGRG
ncbi:MAG TPA: phosphoribosylamine--glycine ligase [Candidatus Polarisedimenticolia bacterium]|jgi:phosphoribosylamine--glycine ligase|nr:phosphoribosylamine--glycine ligase [Candidatus Polarisedimenticolia bacterium]